MITVFKTSVIHHDDVRKVRPLLNRLVWPSGKWNFDLDDRDHILRIESEVDVSVVIDSLVAEGYECHELGDEQV